MPDDHPQAMRSTRKMCETVSEVVLDLFVDKLLLAVKLDASGVLDHHAIADLAREFKIRGRRKYLNRAQKIAEDWLSRIEREIWDQTRKHPFERVLVNRFSYLFPPAESLANDTAVSRRALPGLFLAFERMAGAEFIQQCEATGRGIFRKVKEERGDTFRWMNFYGDQSANDLVDDLLVVIAWGFRDIEVRLAWLRDLINANLAPPEDYAFEGPAVDNWTLGDRALLELLQALFSDFNDKLKADDSRRHVERRYGTRACEALEALLAQLDASS
ncbi:MAG: hypothetical protein QGG17_04430 [Rhodospirillales bacterium]|jgi:hypothetical protein|nr:hypothetical protein [Rhodospirillales bacterium]MDP6804306.1 hypothetical protein [Rhodospirillales bacterium]